MPIYYYFMLLLELHTGGTNQGPAYYQECVSLFGKKVFMKPVNGVTDTERTDL